MKKILYICNCADIYKCTTCFHSKPHEKIIIDNKPCTCEDWCIPVNEQTGIQTKCVLIDGDDDEQY